VEILGRFQDEAFLIVLRDLREAVRFEEAWKKKEKELHEKIREKDQYGQNFRP
jgi:hypothetical protein